MSLFRELLPQWISVAEIDPRSADPSALLAGEGASVATAVEQRRREFAAGRLLARRLLKSFGHTGPLSRQPDGLPEWPPGVVGSITHCVSLAAVAIGRAADCSGIGIDIEVNRPMPGGVRKLILTDEERRWSEASPVAALQVFCAKEALYKAIFPLCHKFVEFDSVIIEPSKVARGFTACLRDEVSPFQKGTEFKGRWHVSSRYVAASVVLP
jgi:4'-phosphopantetheinyl transferase EntD